VSVRPHPDGPDRHGRPRCIIDWYPGGSARRQQRVFHGTVAAARKWERENVADRDRSAWGLAAERSFGQLAAEFIAEKVAADRADGTLDHFRVIFTKHLAGWADRPADSITPRDVAGYLELRKAAGISPVSRKRERRLLRGLYLWAQAHGYARADPVRSVPVPLVEAKPARWLLPVEYARIWRAAPEHTRALMDCMVVFGLRVGELCRMERERIRGDLVYVPGRKANDWLALPLPATMRRLLESQPPRSDGLIWTRPPLYRGQRQRHDRWTKDSSLRAIKSAVRAAKPPVEGKVGNHTLRHTCASWMVAAGVPIYTVRGVLGHSTVVTTEGYAHLALAGLQEQFKKLPARTLAAFGELLKMLTTFSLGLRFPDAPEPTRPRARPTRRTTPNRKKRRALHARTA
jgi:integrase